MLHKYYLTQRGVGPGCQPSGFTAWQETQDGELTTGKRCYGFVTYDRELTPEELKAYELVPHSDTVRLREYKPFKGWHEFAEKTKQESYYDYAKPGDIVDEETMDYFMDVLPPRSMGHGYLQMGEPYSHAEDEAGRLRPTFMTFEKRGGKCYYLGTCFAGGHKSMI